MEKFGLTTKVLSVYIKPAHLKLQIGGRWLAGFKAVSCTAFHSQ
jgi:hypothetical protein